MPGSQSPRRLTTFRRAGLKFGVIDSGPIDGEPVVLLHGFPERAASWRQVAHRLHDNQLRTYALDQRGYAPRARPRSRFSYRISELVADVEELIALIGQPVHIVGHDWGGVVAWAVAAEHPADVKSLTAISVPHPSAFLRSMVTSLQGLKSWYMLFFQLPWLPQLALSNRTVATYALRTAGMSTTDLDNYFAHIVEDGALPGGLGWYRSLPLNDPRRIGKVSVPVTYVWSDRDVALGRKGAELCSRWVTGPYRLAVIDGASHWLVTQHADAVADLVIDQTQSS